MTTQAQPPSETVLALAAWQLPDNDYRPADYMLKETLLSLGNGYLGTRGSFEEGAPAGVLHCEGTYLNGVYSSEPIVYGESAYAFAKHNHKMLQVANGKVLRVSVDQQSVNIEGALSHQRQLDMQSGVLHRNWIWQSQSGKQLQLQSRRFISQQRPQLLVIELTLTALNFSGPVTLSSALDAAYAGYHKADDPRVGVMSIADSLSLRQQALLPQGGQMLHQAKGSDSWVVACWQDQLPAATPSLPPAITTDNYLQQEYQLQLEQGKPLSVHKLVVYQHAAAGVDTAQLCQQAQQTLQDAASAGFNTLLTEQQQWWQQFWQGADLEIAGDLALQQGIRFNLFSLAQSAGRNGQSNIAAKGLTGPGYDGHYFWDTEVYVIPVMSLLQPGLARQLLAHRYSQLPAARARARQMSHQRGALYPWRTIGGEECSAYFPAGTAQYHINAAIAYAIRSYYLASGDRDFMASMGMEMLVETSRLWLELGFFNPRAGGRFEIHQVTGPDEYTAIVNNNYYTNAMVKLQLSFCCELLTAEPTWANRLGVSSEELAKWQQAASQMYLPYDSELQIHAQDDSFLQKQRWDFANTPAEKYPLLLHFHPLVIYRHQVLKQADTVLANVLLDDQISPAQKARDLAYYEPLTTHDSSLSACIHSIAFAETGDIARAQHFFGDSARMDLDNHHGNTEVGVHIACMAGSWLSLVQGFAGVRVRTDGLYLAPKLPPQLGQLRFHLQYQQRLLRITVTATEARCELLRGEPLTLYLHGQPVTLTTGAHL